MRFAILFLVACSSHATKPAHDEPVARGSDATPVEAPRPTIDAARVIPNVDTACQGNGDCEITSDDLEGEHMCCPGCSPSAVSKSSYKAFREACTAAPAKMCPPLGCLMKQMSAVCEAGHCVAKDARELAKPSVAP